MADDNKSPFKLNRSRIILLLFGALALVTVLGALMGSLRGYNEVREAVKAPAPVTAPATNP